MMSTGLGVTIIATLAIVAMILYILLDFSPSRPAEAPPTEEPGEAAPDFFRVAPKINHTPPPSGPVAPLSAIAATRPRMQEAPEPEGPPPILGKARGFMSAAPAPAQNDPLAYTPDPPPITQPRVMVPPPMPASIPAAPPLTAVRPAPVPPLAPPFAPPPEPPPVVRPSPVYEPALKLAPAPVPVPPPAPVPVFMPPPAQAPAPAFVPAPAPPPRYMEPEPPTAPPPAPEAAAPVAARAPAPPRMTDLDDDSESSDVPDRPPVDMRARARAAELESDTEPDPEPVFEAPPPPAAPPATTIAAPPAPTVVAPPEPVVPPEPEETPTPEVIFTPEVAPAPPPTPATVIAPPAPVTVPASAPAKPAEPVPVLRFDAVIRGDSSKHSDGRERRTIAVKKKEAAGFPYREGSRVPIDLEVLGTTYGAGVRATASQTVVYIAADLRGPLGENVTLASVLEGARLQKKQHVTLEVQGTVVRLLPAQPAPAPNA